MERVPNSGPTIRNALCTSLLGHFLLSTRGVTHTFVGAGKICTKYADVMRHRVKFSRPGDRDLCTMTLNYPSVRSKISLHGTDPRFLCMYLRCDGIL